MTRRETRMKRRVEATRGSTMPLLGVFEPMVDETGANELATAGLQDFTRLTQLPSEPVGEAIYDVLTAVLRKHSTRIFWMCNTLNSTFIQRFLESDHIREFFAGRLEGRLCSIHFETTEESRFIDHDLEAVNKRHLALNRSSPRFQVAKANDDRTDDLFLVWERDHDLYLRCSPELGLFKLVIQHKGSFIIVSTSSDLADTGLGLTGVKLTEWKERVRGGTAKFEWYEQGSAGLTKVLDLLVRANPGTNYTDGVTRTVDEMD